MSPRNLCIVPEYLSNRCSANGTGKSRVISCHSRDIGVECLLFCNHYKDDGRGHVQYQDLKGSPSVLIKVDKIAVCGSCGQVFESTSHMSRIMVSGKPSNRSARGVDIPPTTRNLVFRACTDVREYVPHSGQEYGHVVALQTYVLHIYVRMVLQSLVVALIHESE
jgi:hypothetical protein